MRARGAAAGPGAARRTLRRAAGAAAEAGACACMPRRSTATTPHASPAACSPHSIGPLRVDAVETGEQPAVRAPLKLKLPQHSTAQQSETVVAA